MPSDNAKLILQGILAFLVAFIFMWLWFSFFPPKAYSHEGPGSWISKDGLRNSKGEWCCGPGDCFEIPAKQVQARADGYHIWLVQVFDARDQLKAEIVPYSEVQPSPDGTYVRCKYPDGRRRCFFAPPPNT